MTAPYDGTVLDLTGCHADVVWQRAVGVPNVPDRLETLLRVHRSLQERVDQAVRFTDREAEAARLVGDSRARSFARDLAHLLRTGVAMHITDDDQALCGARAIDVPELAAAGYATDSWIPCMLPAGHDPRAGHWSTSGCAGGVCRWTDDGDVL